MSDNKKYYYLKLKENFFDSDELKILESMPNGVYYSNLLLKLYLKSLKYEGRLKLNEYIPYSPEMISTITNINIDTVRTGLKILEQLKLIEVLPDGTIYMLEIQNYIGKSSSEGDRVREYRKKIEEEKVKELPESTKVVQMYDERTPEIELELKKEIDINIENIFNHWNDCKIVVHRKITKDIEKAYKKVIKDYTVDEIKIAIKNYSKILKDDKYFFKYKWSLDEFLTRGLTKFLDWKICSNNFIKNTIGKGKDSFNNFEQREYDYDSLEKQLLGVGNTEETEFNGEDLLKEIRSAKGLN